MNLPDINLYAVILATLSSVIVGFVFYHPRVCGMGWMRAVGHTEESVRDVSPALYLIPTIGSLITAVVMSAAAWSSFQLYGGSFLVSSTVTAMVLYIGFTVTRMLAHDAFDSRGFAVSRYTLLNELITIVIMSLIIGVWPPAGTLA